MRTFETPEPISATIELVVGSATVIAGNRTDTVVEVRPSDDSKAADIRAAEQTRVEYSAGVLRVLAPKSWKRYTRFGDSESIEVTIHLPTGSNVDGDREWVISAVRVTLASAA